MKLSLATKTVIAVAALFPLPALASTMNPTVSSWQITTYDTMTADGLVETTQTSALGNTSKSRLDGLSRTLQTVDALGNISVTAHDNNGNALSSRDANGVGQDFIYDQRNRQTVCTDTMGATTVTKYSVGGLVLNQQDGKGVLRAKDISYDARGRMVSKATKLDNSDTTYFTYDANDNRLTITDGEGKITSYEYDNRNLRVAWVFPGHDVTKSLGQSGYDKVAYEYDAAGRLVAFLRQDGTRDENIYAFNGTLIQKQFKNAAGTVTSVDSFLYDLNNRLVQAIKGRYNNTVQLAYDVIGRKQSEKLLMGTPNNSSASYTTQYGYDADNRNTTITYPDGKVVTRTYTQRDHLQSVSLNSQSILTNTIYDAGGREIQRTLGNGTQQIRAYRNDSLLSSMITTGDASSSVNYGYDQNRNLTSETFQGSLANLSTSLAQDAKDRLTQFTRINGDTTNWTLTKEGNWSNLAGSQSGQTVNQTRTHNDSHQITAIAGAITATPAYDAQGDLATDEQGRAYMWDQEKQLQGVVGGTTNVGYAYDAMGRRVSKTSNGSTTVYISAGSQEIQEYIGSIAVKTYVFGTYVDEVLAQQDNAGSNLYYIGDRRYSTTTLADQNGAIIERYVYDPYGSVTVLDASGMVKSGPAMTEILWTGRRQDDTGNYYFRSRYFSTTLGRFISRDVDYLDGRNLYEGYFAEWGGTDPLGLFDNRHCVTFGLSPQLSWSLGNANADTGYLPAGPLAAIGMKFRMIIKQSQLKMNSLEVKKCNCQCDKWVYGGKWGGSFGMSMDLMLGWGAKSPSTSGFYYDIFAGGVATIGFEGGISGEASYDECKKKGTLSFTGGVTGSVDLGLRVSGSAGINVFGFRRSGYILGQIGLKGELRADVGVVCDNQSCRARFRSGFKGTAYGHISAGLQISEPGEPDVKWELFKYGFERGADLTMGEYGYNFQLGHSYSDLFSIK